MSILPVDSRVNAGEDNSRHSLPEEDEAYLHLVEEWANAPAPVKANLVYTPFSLALAKAKVKAKFCENIASFIKAVKAENDVLASNPDKVDPKENIQSYLNLLVNVSVTGALIFAVLFGFVVNDLSPSQESIDFFGDTTVRVFKYLFLICVNISVFCSLFMIFLAVSFYKHLGFWMPDIQAQTEWMKQVSITPPIVICAAVVHAAGIAMPFGAAVAISPIAGLISSCLLIALWLGTRYVMYIEEHSEIVLQRATRRILEERKQLLLA